MAGLGQIVHYTTPEGKEVPALIARLGMSGTDLVIFPNEEATDDTSYFPSKGGGEIVKNVAFGDGKGMYHEVGAAAPPPSEPEAVTASADAVTMSDEDRAAIQENAINTKTPSKADARASARPKAKRH